MTPNPDYTPASPEIQAYWDTLPDHLRARGDWLLMRRRVKDAELMFAAAIEIEQMRTLYEYASGQV